MASATLLRAALPAGSSPGRLDQCGSAAELGGAEIPTWDGHKNPKWQYKNGSSWVDVPAGATVSSIAATDDNTNPIVLRLLWATDTARITYAAQEGGSAAGGALTVPAKGSASEDINAVSGTPTAMTATAASGYKFDGWYNGGTLVTNNATLTVTKNPTSGLFETATYTAHFSKLATLPMPSSITSSRLMAPMSSTMV